MISWYSGFSWSDSCEPTPVHWSMYWVWTCFCVCFRVPASAQSDGRVQQQPVHWTHRNQSDGFHSASTSWFDSATQKLLISLRLVNVLSGNMTNTKCQCINNTQWKVKEHVRVLSQLELFKLPGTDGALLLCFLFQGNDWKNFLQLRWNSCDVCWSENKSLHPFLYLSSNPRRGEEVNIKSFSP